MNKKTYNLSAQKREIVGKKVKNLRNKGLIPAVLYGRGADPVLVSVLKADFDKVYEEAGTSSLIDLIIDSGQPIKVLAHEPQNDPVSGKPIHIDFYRIKMDEKIKTEIPLEFIGTSEAVEQLEGSLVKNKDSVDVECLPNDLVSAIQIDISSLKNFEDTIKISDLLKPHGIEILHEADEIIALVEEPRSEEELAELEEASAEDEEKEALEKMGSEAEEGAEKGEDENKEEPSEDAAKPDRAAPAGEIVPDKKPE